MPDCRGFPIFRVAFEDQVPSKRNFLSSILLDLFRAVFYEIGMILTERQRKIISFLESFRAKHGVRPSYREIMDGVGFKSKAPVAYALNKLATIGAIKLVYGPDNKQVRDIIVVGWK